MKYQYLIIGIVFLVFLVPTVKAVPISQCLNDTYLNVFEQYDINVSGTSFTNTMNQSFPCQKGCDLLTNQCIDVSPDNLGFIIIVSVIIAGVFAFLSMFIDRKEHPALQLLLLGITLLVIILTAGMMIEFANETASLNIATTTTTLYTILIISLFVIVMYIFVMMVYKFYQSILKKKRGEDEEQ